MASIIHAKDLRSGHTFTLDGKIYLVIENSFNKTAMREGIVKCKVKNLRTGSITTEVLTGMKLEQANIEKIKMSFVYQDQNSFVFMNNETYEQIEVPAKLLEYEKNFITENTEALIMRYEDEILGVNLPDQVVIEIDYAEDAVQGNSVNNALKKATLVTGYVIEVPQFIKSKEKVIVSTVDGKYVSRAN
ncbi:elongation factor P [Mycoplasmoides gallisepticum S6]|uniref:Elongation factor P n=1 Tax=Mycoplasmoides gallisepticum S6 TaxID=1006581 RepID=A0A0F6CL01_MYCGL|nr:elongation factor P [Mycoplasmoides gallisepticum]AHB99773.1 elongation factor P [Mycoplasmoides gallisepticum S6]